MPSQKLNALGTEIVDCAYTVHRSIGPGLLERVYETCFVRELELRGIHVETQVPIAFRYKGLQIEDAYRLDMIIERQIIVELKAVEKLLPVHSAQLLSYMKLAKCPLGYLVNFNVPLIKEGIHRIAL